MTALAPDFHPDYYDRQEALAEWRAFLNLPDVDSDEYWITVAQEILAPLPAALPYPPEECDF